MRTGVLSWESQAPEVLGVAAGAEPTDLDELAAAIHPEDVAELRAALDQLPIVGAVDVGLRVGEEAALRYLSLRGRVLDRDRRGRALRAVGLVVDVTTEKAMQDQMLRMLLSDALTGVPNRRAFDQALRTEWRRSSRGLEPLSVLMIDIDNFKGFNDTFGHLVGDEALIAVGRALTAAVHRPGDVLARFGGEEFALVAPGLDEVGVLVVANRLVEAVRAVTVRQAADWSLSVSIGAATWQPGCAVMKAVELLALADRALYLAKSGGKDRAVACPAPVGPASDPASDPKVGPRAGSKSGPVRGVEASAGG